MPDVPKPPVTPKPKRGFWRRVLRWSGCLLLFVALFHRPLFHHGVRFAAIRAAAFQHLRLDFHLSGSIFTNLVIDSVHLEPIGDAPTPVKKIAIEHLRFDYSFPELVKNGVGEFLRSYAVRNADLELVALPSKSTGEKKQKRAIAEQLNAILAQPAAYADRVNIENFNVTVTAPENVTRVQGFHLFLDPEKLGHLRIARLEIPGVPVWENLSAATSYEARNLFIKDLKLAPELVIDALNFDASQRAQGKGGILLQAHTFGGTLQLSLAGSQLNKKGENLEKSYNTQLAVSVENVDLPAAAKYFGAPPPPVAKLGKLTLNFIGEPELPRTWQGGAEIRVKRLAAGKALTVDGIGLTAKFDKGRATIAPLQATAGKNTVAINAEVWLPESVNDFPKSELEATLKLDAPDLPTLTSTMPKPLTGRANGDGKVKLSNSQLDLNLNLDAAEIAGDNLALSTGKVVLRASKRLDAPKEKPFAQLDGKITAELAALRVGTFAIDAVSLDAEAREQLVTVHRLEVRRGDNAISAQGTYRIPDDLREAARTPTDVQFTIAVPKLQDFGIGAKDTLLAGRIDGQGAVKLVNGALTGGLQLDGGAFAFGEFKAEKLAAKIQLADNQASIEQLALQFNATDQLAIVGKAGIQAPFPYEGSLLVAIKNLAMLQPLLAIFSVKEELAGGLDIEWAGSGEASAPAGPPPPPDAAPTPPNHTGKLSVTVAKAHYGKIDLSEFKLAGQYRPGFAESTEFRAKSGPTALATKIEWEENRLRLRDLEVDQAGTKVLSGFVLIPLNPMAKPPIPTDGRIAANLNANKLDLDKLLGSFGQTSPVSGTLTASLISGGTLLAPAGHLKVQGRTLKAKAVPQLEPSNLDLDLHYAEKKLELDATLKQAQMQPLTIKGQVPLDLEAVAKQGKLDPKLPLDVTARLPQSSLAFVPKLTPQVARIDGTAGLDVKVGGTVEKPAISGNLIVVLKSARIANDNVPAIGAFDGKVDFANDTVTFERFRGEIGGGTFNLGGTIKIADPKDPVFDLRLQSKEVLVKRDDSITVRADTDLKVTGPLKAGSATGEVFITHSRFFKEIDILPIGLPGRPPPPAPKSASSGPSVISFPNPPIRDWKFDIAIKTRPEDPFLVRGNMANGAVAINLKLAGTGLEPYLDGNLRVDKFDASLPFSKLSITRGFIYFKKDEPFQPSLDLQAESKLRDYTVGAYIHGRAGDPQIEFTSDPPLAHADIVSLLATGTTTSELAGNADVLASRAAMLAVQSLYRKIFKRGAGPPPEEKAGAGSIMDRFQLELGAVDTRTGGREITTRFKLNEHYYLIGDMSTDGRFTGRLKYLIRFR
jgi:hypothetical protein